MHELPRRKNESPRCTGLLLALLLVVACEPPGDTQSPTVNFVGLSDGDTLNCAVDTIKANATDNVSVAKVEFYVDGALKATDSSGTAGVYSFAWDASAESAGSQHAIRATGYDASGNNASTTATVNLRGSGGPTHHNLNIYADETWSPSGNPHIVDRTIVVQGLATLTIRPGCIVRFAAGAALFCSNGINLEAGLKAIGTADSTILFTSAAASPAKGDWRFVAVGDRALATEFEYCIFEYGGAAPDSGTVLLWGTGTAKLDHCTIRQSKDYGVVCASATTAFSQFTNNTITGCDRYPVHIFPPMVPTIGAGNTLTGNAKSGVEVDCAPASHFVSSSATWLNPGVPYVLTGDLFVGEYTSPVLTIAPGCTLQLPAGSSFNVGSSSLAPGGLIANGTSGQIVFTSALAAPGSWFGLNFGVGSAALPCSLVNCKVEYGGADATTRSNVHTYYSAPVITGSSIGHSSTFGVYFVGTTHPDSTQLETDNTFYDCASGNVGHP